MDPAAALLSGALAGLAIAMPVGAIGVLLIQEGMRRGLRAGLPGAAGVAAVDTVYCLIAVAAGAAVAPLIARIGPWPAILGGIALLVLAVVGLRRGLAARPAADTAAGESAPARRGASAAASFSLFFGLTLVNPATVVYFIAIAAGLGELHRDAAASTLFVLGAGVASFAWQALLVAAGALFGRRASPRVQHATVLVGYLVVAALGIALIVRAVV